MKVPATFQLAGNTWTVTLKPKRVLKDAYGQCMPETHEIWIREGMEPPHDFQTFLHEAGHALLFTHGFLGDHEEHERMIEGVTQLVYQLLLTMEGEAE